METMKRLLERDLVMKVREKRAWQNAATMKLVPLARQRREHVPHRGEVVAHAILTRDYSGLFL